MLFTMMQHSPRSKLIGRIQSDACETILQLLDDASHFALTEAKAQPRDVAHCEQVVRTVKFTSHTDECAADEYRHKESTHYVHKLRFTNCLALVSEVLLGYDASCENFCDLCRANGITETPVLFRMLCQRPANENNQGCSLCDDHRYESRLEKDVSADISRHWHLLTIMLKFTYVEVVGTPLTAGFLYCILSGSRDMQPLHVRAIRQATVRVPVMDACVKCNTRRDGLHSFQYTCERVPPNIGCLWREASCSYVCLEDVLEQRTLLQGVRHAAVAVEADSEAACRFLRATTYQGCWYDVRSISLFLLASPQQIRFQRHSCVVRYCVNSIQMFLRMCLANISELNVTSSHFSFGCDFCCCLGPGLFKLSMLALRPCAISCEELFQCLARGCQFLNELVFRNDDVVPCTTCKLSLMFTERDMEWLLRETRLWRLSICDTVGILSVTFLLGRRVTDLHFILNSLASDITQVSYCGPCHLIGCANRGHSMLTVESLQLALGEHALISARLTTAQSALCFLEGTLAIGIAATTLAEHVVHALPPLQPEFVRQVILPSSPSGGANLIGALSRAGYWETSMNFWTAPST